MDNISTYIHIKNISKSNEWNPNTKNNIDKLDSCINKIVYICKQYNQQSIKKI